MRGDRRVVITGMGCISPVGNSVESAWDAVCNGRSGIGPLQAFDPEDFTAKIAGEIRDFDVGDYMSPREARRSDTFIHYGIAAAAEAIEDAGLDDSGINPERIGLAVGAGIGGIASIE
ncbi:MAG TPA: beta-ketoacyl synthase N-terminal-like domain-containing protein, partial [Wenzhouxiangella sp.]|nr:beta-ketoacyl synthase N-terminal-like domain-containing protein [Wenzhouxiangella sp.]